jgi:brefeldin A-resistance guanine nucleotide exchange factor 1
VVGSKLMLLDNNLLPQNLDPKSVAVFLRTGFGLNKTLIGEYLGKKKDFNIAVLEAYVETFEFQNDARYIDSIRSFLESFRIPGEAPIIARILEAFAKNYFALVKEPFANADAAYILAYSVVMLNVDQHNPQVTHRMTEQEFIRNNRGINDKKDLPQEMLKDIYYSIKNYEMKIPEEQLGLDIHNSWRHTLSRSKIIGEFKTYQTGNYDQDLFAVIWGPLIAAISVGNYCSLHIQLTLI